MKVPWVTIQATEMVQLRQLFRHRRFSTTISMCKVWLSKDMFLQTQTATISSQLKTSLMAQLITNLLHSNDSSTARTKTTIFNLPKDQGRHPLDKKTSSFTRLQSWSMKMAKTTSSANSRFSTKRHTCLAPQSTRTKTSQWWSMTEVATAMSTGSTRSTSIKKQRAWLELATSQESDGIAGTPLPEMAALRLAQVPLQARLEAWSSMRTTTQLRSSNLAPLVAMTSLVLRTKLMRTMMTWWESISSLSKTLKRTTAMRTGNQQAKRAIQSRSHSTKGLGEIKAMTATSRFKLGRRLILSMSTCKAATLLPRIHITIQSMWHLELAMDQITKVLVMQTSRSAKSVLIWKRLRISQQVGQLLQGVVCRWILERKMPSHLWMNTLQMCR